jgi:hypothetical protein
VVNLQGTGKTPGKADTLRPGASSAQALQG